MNEFEFLEGTWVEFQRKATARRVRIHPSTLLAVQNYLLRRGVRRVSDAGKVQIARDILQAVIEKEEPDAVITAGSISAHLEDRCEDPFGMCNTSALKTLEQENDILGVQAVARVEKKFSDE